MDKKKEELLELRTKVAQLADDAFLLFRDSKLSESSVKYKEAFAIEKEVADWFIEQAIEPQRSVIALNAAHLAADAGENKQAIYYSTKVIEFALDEKLVREARTILKHINE
jgi:hypothetical protein